MFIVKSLFENLEVVNGSRGLGGQPKWADLLTVFIWTIACIWIINNFVRSTLGKALGTSGAFVAGSEALIETLTNRIAQLSRDIEREGGLCLLYPQPARSGSD